MIRKKMYKKIQSFKRQGYSRNEIAAELGIDPKTTAKYFQMNQGEFQAYRKEHMFRDKVFSEYEKDILQVYEQNEFKKLNMTSVYDFLEEKYGQLPWAEKTLRNYVNYLIETEKLSLNENIRIYRKVPELPFGKQMQFDFGQFRLRSGLKLFIFAAVLSASRYRYVIFQDHPFKTREVIYHLLSCFDYFGGVPKELVIDQDSLMVVSENAGDIIYTDDFKYFIQEQKTSMYVCRASDPETKGKVESLVKYVKYNFLSIRDFKSIDAVNESVLRWLKRRANGKISQATMKIPALLIEYERKELRPLRNSIFKKESLLGREDRSVNEKACISVDSCLYQLPLRYRNKSVEIYETDQKLFIFDIYSGEEIVAYDISLIPGQLICKREYKRESDRTVKELKEQVTGIFDTENWEKFTEKNIKAFPRYVRDQCLEAKKYFTDKDIDIDLLDEALKYCLKNDTLSFANLKDTYAYFKREENLLKNMPEQPQTTSGKFRVDHKPLNINQRDLSVYKDIISKREQSHESI